MTPEIVALDNDERQAIHNPHSVRINADWRGCPVCRDYFAVVERIVTARLAPVWTILHAWEAWDGSPGPDGRIHPDASSPRDRDRLRAALSRTSSSPAGDDRG